MRMGRYMWREHVEVFSDCLYFLSEIGSKLRVREKKR